MRGVSRRRSRAPGGVRSAAAELSEVLMAMRVRAAGTGAPRVPLGALPSPHPLLPAPPYYKNSIPSLQFLLLWL